MFASVSSVQSKFQCSLYTSDVFHFTTIIENYNVCRFFLFCLGVGVGGAGVFFSFFLFHREGGAVFFLDF